MQIDGDDSLRILIVAADCVDREVYRRCLEHSCSDQSFEFAEADTAAAGIEISRKFHPHCALVDCSLPDMDGLEALSNFKDESGRPACAIVMLTTDDGRNLAVQAMKAGATDYLRKEQVAPTAFARVILNAIERFRMQELHQALLDAIPQMAWTADAAGCVQYANRQWLGYTGLRLEQAKRLGWDRLVHPEDRERSWSAWSEAVSSGSAFEIEHRIKRASDRSFRWHLGRAVPVRTGPGEITAWLGTYTEIEGPKRIETAVLENQRIEGIGRLAGGVAHDFNNLLTVVMCGASLAMESLPESHPARENLERVAQAVERAAQLTGKMLICAGKSHSEAALTDIDQQVREALVRMKDSIPPAIHLDFRKSGDLLPVRTDPGQLRQVVTELVTNAVEAIGGRAGAISIRSWVDEIGDAAAEPGDNGMADHTHAKYVALEIRDTGCGMDSETQKKIFDPFFTTKFTGRGLGLAAVHGFARSNRGRVLVNSWPGKGSSFRVLLPAVMEVNNSRGAGS